MPTVVLRLPQDEDELVSQRRHERQNAQSGPQQDAKRTPILENGRAPIGRYPHDLEPRRLDDAAPPGGGGAKLERLIRSHVEVRHDDRCQTTWRENASHFVEAAPNIREVLDGAEGEDTVDATVTKGKGGAVSMHPKTVRHMAIRQLERTSGEVHPNAKPNVTASERERDRGAGTAAEVEEGRAREWLEVTQTSP
jgi:hypothetical protein